MSSSETGIFGISADTHGKMGGMLAGGEIEHHKTEALLIVIIIAISAVAIFILFTETIRDIILRDLRSPVFILGIIAIIIFLSWVFLRYKGSTEAELYDSRRLEAATKHAIVGLIIAYLAHLDLYFLTFVIVFAFVYFLTDWF